MNYSLSHYATLVFDCDGVVLNSNRIKTEAFYQTTLCFGEGAARAMVDYHVANGGLSRYAKFAHFLEHIAPIYAPNVNSTNIQQLLAQFATAVKQGILECEIIDGLYELREQTKEARWMVVSGGDQVELLETFAARGIANLFDGGIYGSPDPKPKILAREIANGNIKHPAIFFGDSKYDYHCAKVSGLDFVFIHGWSEVVDWQRFVQEKGIVFVARVADTLNALGEKGIGL